MDNRVARIEIENIEVSQETGILDVVLVIHNDGDSAILVPRFFTSPDPYIITLQDAQDNRIAQTKDSHAFSFCARREATQCLAPGQTIRSSFNLAEFFLTLDRGHYQLSVTLNMSEYLQKLQCQTSTDTDTDRNEYIVKPALSMPFFLPCRLASHVLDDLEDAKINYLRKYIFSWKRPVSWYPALKSWWIRSRQSGSARH